MLKKELTKEEKEKRETLLSDISSKMVLLLQDFDADITEENIPWYEDLNDVFDGDKDTIDMYSRSMHDYFEIEPVSFEAASVFPMFEESNAFDTLSELYSYTVYLVLEKHDLLRDDEKLR